MSGGAPILLFILAPLLIGGFAYLSWMQAKKRREELAAFAASMGWSYTARDDGWTQRWQGTPFHQGFDREAKNILQGTHDGKPVVAFDYSYKTETTDGKGNTQTQTHTFGVAAVSLPCFLPTLEVEHENLLTRVGNALGLDDIELESEDFNRRFRVHATDRKFAIDVLNPRAMEMLLALDPGPWRIEGSDILAWKNGRYSVGDIQQHLLVLEKVMAGIPEFVWKDHGTTPPPGQ